MKRFFGFILIAAFALLSLAGARAQVLAFRLDGEGRLSFRKSLIDVKDAGEAIDADLGSPQGIFLYVRHDTPVSAVMDFMAVAKKACTYPVAVVCPLARNDKDRKYGPVAVRFADVPLKKKSGAQVVDLASGDGVGVALGDSTSGMLFRTKKTALSPGRVFTLVTVDIADFGMYTKDSTGIDDPLMYEGPGGMVDAAAFLLGFQTVGTGKEAGKGSADVEFVVTPLGTVEDVRIVRTSGVPGLDEALAGALGEMPPFWSVPTTGNKPCYARVTASVRGEMKKAASQKKPEYKDWAKFYRYEDANARMEARPAAVLMGDSITDGWAKNDPDWFREYNLAGRGISGQTTSEMLVRFRPDVIDLHPEYVVILAGINDIARNNGFIRLSKVYGNIVSMVELARFNGITPVLCTLLPAHELGWRKALGDPRPQIDSLNSMIKGYASDNDIPVIDYHSAMKDGQGAMREPLRWDAVHPNKEGYKVMEKTFLGVMLPILDKSGRK